MANLYFATALSGQTINQAFGTPENVYNQMHDTAVPEALNFFGIAVSFIALFLFIRAFLR